MKASPMVEIRDLRKWFPVKSGFKVKSHLKAVDGVDLEIVKGETLGLVGESGCGKTTIGRTLIKIYQPTGGEFFYRGEGSPEGGIDIFSLSESKMRPFRREIQMVFQDPYASLNPRLTVFDIIAEGLRVHSVGRSKEERKTMIAEILEKVGLRPEYMFRYPHEFSGGQRQRIGIARSIVLNPSLVICDEPVSALDVSVQAQVINLLEDLKHDFGLTYLFIAHDLAVVKHICDSISVMYLGKIVETAETDSLFNDPLHPYTKGLLSSIPIPNPHLRSARKREIVKGDIPSPVDPPETCRFVKRCPRAFDRCWKESPSLKEVSEGHFVSCFLYD
ncbi:MULTISPECIES: ABC transporter ATP-binding protein [Mesotoga]|jgi:oligopeptide/dipeptide ABC transporter ATP-binding protein|uniref:ABC transporter ATP-binding protein n=1 Tax=Mesotoga TaxID=1184396 RepID=UPI0002C96156|nr:MULTISPECIES: oligopeptide/dipeptide ABC transporter ATP-binding protein [Mesotoga]MCP5457287.1 ATP-binding cassette domain-containing protein [Thermotogota bacterium]CCU84313.1 putative oligopeptide transport ATP-binding protein YkfD [Mesotoga infera]HPJ32301.1 ATP-binding cassette domain-containing protein [Mesotoga prima]HPQ91755.1 ATP-binding cassette domain-containing protein [Mesotoga prima]HRX64823.1 ATP-binding cassette domain-containing protein [Mesotoga sp.]